MTDAAEVKAHIKLRFKNRNEHTCVVTRALQVTKKRTKLEYKALEAALSTLDLQGRRTSISMKCTEVDRIIPENLGVSAAILENVIFVHQEDSNWPMQEGMVLKKKFDDIFESTRYTKALEALTKTKKDVTAKAKDLKVELAEYSAHLTTVHNHQQELATCLENEELCVTELDSLKARLERNEQKVKRSKDIVDATNAHAADLQKLTWQVNEAERRVQEKDRTLEQKLDASDEELQRMINNFESAMATKNKELRYLTGNVETIRVNIGKIREEIARLNTKKGQADLLLDQAKQAKLGQLELVRGIAKKYSALPTPGGEWNARTMQDYSHSLTRELERAQADIQEQVSRARAGLTDIDRAYQRLRSQIQEVEVELKLKTDEDSSLLTEWDAKRAEKSRLSSSTAAIQRAQAACDAAQAHSDEHMATFNTKSNDFKVRIKEAVDQIHTLQDEINSGAQMLQELSLHRNEIAAMEATSQHLNTELDNVKADLASTFSMYRDILDGLMPSDPAGMDHFVEQFAGKTSAAEQRHKTSREEVSALKTSLASKDALLSQLSSQRQALRPKEAEYNAIANEMKAFIPQLNALRDGKVLVGCNLGHIAMDIAAQDLLDVAKATEDEARELLVIAKSGKVFLKRIKKMRQQSPNSCPCCGQGMNDATVQQGFETRIKTLFSFGDEEQQGTVDEHKDTFAACQKIYEGLTKLHGRMMLLASVGQDLATIETNSRELTRDKHSIEDQLRARENTLQDLERTAGRYSKAHRSLSEVSVRWKGVDQRLGELADRKRRQSQNYLSGDAGMTYDQLEQLQRDRQDRKDQLQVTKERLQADESSASKRSYQLKTIAAEAVQALANAKLEGKKAEEIEATIARLQAKHEELDIRKKSLNNDRDRLTREMSEVTVQLTAKRSDVHQLEERLAIKVSGLQGDKDQFHKFSQQIDELERRYADADLDKVNDTLREATASIEQKEAEIKALSPRIASINTELGSQEHTKRNISANLDLRVNILELAGVRDQLAAKQAQVGGHAGQLAEAQAQLAAAQREKDTLSSERDTLRGKLEIHRQRALDIDATLNRAPYKGVEEKHRRKNIEYETTNMAVSDLDNYYNALDGALQNFHTLKIREINKIIRELWQLIYQGQDIDNIEIESGSDGAEGAAASGSRSYNYRVVMKKGDVPLDMRGRCSAGQKVLAAIVIRLALAEVFCVDCGILALDEPTTNLDEANKKGLAQALTRLIMGRAKQQNFQLITITHDEDFVQSMRTELASNKDFNLPEYYFRVYRQEDGHTGRYFSHIERIPWEDM